MTEDGNKEFIPPPEFDVDDLGERSYEFPKLQRRRDFLPWHAPRKHYVRKYQWVTCLEDILNGREAVEAIKYLGLPGVDLLDLRYLHKRVCEPRNLPLRFVGFDHSVGSGSQDEIELNVSLQEVKLSSLVDPRSEVHAGDLRDLTSQRSQGFARAKDAAPFDVVNIDLCDNFLFDDPGNERSIYAALSNIFSLQDVNQNPWMLYLTSALNKSEIHDGVIDRLASILEDALRECADFADMCSPLFDGSLPEEFDWASSEGDQFYKWSIIAVCLWTYKLARRRYPNGVNLKASFGYSIRSEADALDMFSIAFKITPKFGSVADPSGLAAHPEAKYDDQCPSYCQFSNRVQHTKNVVSALAADEGVMREVLFESADLLKQARYNSDLYLEWVEDGCRGIS